MFSRMLLACVLLGAITTVAADMFSPSHGCSKPFKPYEFSDEWEYESFMDDVRNYKRCIEDFVEEQNQAARRHAEAAEEAIEEWNRFVRFELN